MKKINTKKRLAILLSKQKIFDDPDCSLEQYPTDSEIAADILWWAYQNGDIKNKQIADFGSGTGILGIGALSLEAKEVIFIEKDKKAIKICKKNIEDLGFTDSILVNSDIDEFEGKTDIIIENPPFGAKKENRNADKKFLLKAFKTAPIIYSFHMASSEKFIEKISKENGFHITHIFRYNFPLKSTMHFHKKKISKIKVNCWRLEKN